MLKYLPYVVKFLFFTLAVVIFSLSPLGLTFFANSLNYYIFIIPSLCFILLIIFYYRVIGRQCLEYFDEDKKK